MIFHGDESYSLTLTIPELPQVRSQNGVILEEVLEYANPEDLKLANSHCLGNIIKSKGPRPMIFICLFWEDRESILERAGKMLKSYNSENNGGSTTRMHFII